MLACDSTASPQPAGIDSVSVIVDALREKFGSTALPIAIKQVEVADGQSITFWQQVVTRLRG